MEPHLTNEDVIDSTQKYIIQATRQQRNLQNLAQVVVLLDSFQPAEKNLGRPTDPQSQPCSSPIPTDDVEENEYDDSQRTDEDDDMTKAQPDLLRDIWEKVNQLGSNASSPRRGRNQKACEACRQAKIRCSATKPCGNCAKKRIRCRYGAGERVNPVKPLELVPSNDGHKQDVGTKRSKTSATTMPVSSGHESISTTATTTVPPTSLDLGSFQRPGTSSLSSDSIGLRSPDRAGLERAYPSAWPSPWSSPWSYPYADPSMLSPGMPSRRPPYGNYAPVRPNLFEPAPTDEWNGV